MRPAFREREVGEFIERGLLSDGLRCRSLIASTPTSAAVTRFGVRVVFMVGILSALDRFIHFTIAIDGGCQVPSRMALSAQ